MLQQHIINSVQHFPLPHPFLRRLRAMACPVQEKGHGSDESDSGGSADGDGWGLLQRACLCYESGSFQGELDAFVR